MPFANINKFRSHIVSQKDPDVEAQRPMKSSENNSEQSTEKFFGSRIEKYVFIAIISIVSLLLIAVLMVTVVILVAVNNTSAALVEVPKSSVEKIKPSQENQQPATISQVAITPAIASCKVIENPEDRVVAIGTDTSLRCKFDQQVECLWLRRSAPVNINRRYSYVATVNKNISNDCSISIKNVKNIDFGEWECVGVFSNNSSIHTQKAELTEDIKVEPEVELHLVVNPTSVKTEIGGAVTLKCEFSKPVECSWTRRGELVNIIGRYSYLDGVVGSRSNCSIVIENVKTIDQGQWICSSMAYHSSTGLNSSPAYVTMSKPQWVDDRPI